MTRVCRLRDPEEVARRAADATAGAARAAIAERGVFAIALAGGDTPRRMYEKLVADTTVDWSRVEFFWGDERTVPPEHPDSNFGMADRALLRPLEIDPRRIHRIAAEREDLAAVARDYEQELAKVCGETGGPPRLDLVLLGMGADGHTASLFPHTSALSESRRWVVANDVPQLSTRRITVAFPLIGCARSVIVLVTGESKAPALAQVLEGRPDPERFPSQRLRAFADVEWLVDAAAASGLRGEGGGAA